MLHMKVQIVSDNKLVRVSNETLNEGLEEREGWRWKK
jgi:hypothetical protein